MIEVIFAIVLFIIYFGIGLPIAAKQHLREVKAGAVKKINIPPMPPKPELKLSEILHTSGIKKCNSLSGDGGTRPCTCISRDEWYATKVGWDKYNDWRLNWYEDWMKQQRRGLSNPTNPAKVVVLWPFYLPGIYVEKAFKNSPDFDYIKYLEEKNEIKGLN